MADIYVVDASSLIDLETLYPRNKHPKVWGRLDLLIEEGLLKAPHAVYREISPTNIPLHTWAKEKAKRRGGTVSRTTDAGQLFVPDGAVRSMAADILAKHRFLVPPHKVEVAADPYIIALARVINNDLTDDVAVIVTEEKNRPDKIPYVANVYEIRSIDVLAFLEEIGL